MSSSWAKQWLDILSDDHWTQRSTQTGKKPRTTPKAFELKYNALNSNRDEEYTRISIKPTSGLITWWSF